MALDCPSCGSSNVVKLTEAMRLGKTHLSADHIAAGYGVGLSTGGVAIGVGRSKGVTKGVQESEVSRALSDEFKSPPPMYEGLDPITCTVFGKFFWLTVCGAVFVYAVWKLPDHISFLPALFRWGLISGAALFGFFGFLLVLLFGRADTKKNREAFRAEMQAARLSEKWVEYDKMMKPGFYCYACGHQFIDTKYNG